MTKEEVFERVKKVFNEMFHNDNVTLETNREDVQNWDSMSHVMFLSAIQKEFKISFKMNDMINLNSIAKIVDSVLELVK